MPLRDPFQPPLANFASWEEVHGLWPGLIAVRLNETLPERYRCGVKIHLGTFVEVDIGAFDRDESGGISDDSNRAIDPAWQCETATTLLETEELTPPEYEVRVYDEQKDRRLVAAIELVSPANKDRPRSRRDFVRKCHAMLQEDVCVVIVDVVTNSSANLFAELAEHLEATPPAIADCGIYAVSCRLRKKGGLIRFETWPHPLSVGSPLPTLPLFLSEKFKVPLDLESTYEATCKGLRIP
jgi:Protein of unknown function (DUF4058)